MIELRADQLGRQGERKFDDLCELADLTVSAFNLDMTGRDRHVEFPFVEPTGTVTYDTRPAPIACYVQVKTLKAPNDRFRMRLSAAERLARETKPSFVCILRMNSKREFTDLHLLHFQDDVLGAVLKRLREEHVKGTIHLNRLWINFSLSRAKQISFAPQALRAAIEAEVPDGMHAYAARKQRQLLELGYDEGRYTLNITFNAVKMSEVVDGFLGLSHLPASSFATFERRFGIDLPSEPNVKEAPGTTHTFKIDPTPVDDCVLTLVNLATGEKSSIRGPLYHPDIPGLEPEFIKILIRAPLFNVSFTNGNVSFSTTPAFGPSQRHPLQVWEDTLHFMALLTEGGATPTIRLSKTGQELDFPRLNVPPKTNDNAWVRPGLRAIRAAMCLRRLASESDEPLDLEGIMKNQREIVSVADLMSGEDTARHLSFVTGLPDRGAAKEVQILYLNALQIADDWYAYAVRTRVVPVEDSGSIKWTSVDLVPLIVEKLREPSPAKLVEFRVKMNKLTGIQNFIGLSPLEDVAAGDSGDKQDSP